MAGADAQTEDSSTRQYHRCGRTAECAARERTRRYSCIRPSGAHHFLARGRQFRPVTLTRGYLQCFVQIPGDEPHQALDQPFDKTGMSVGVTETPQLRSPAAVYYPRRLSSSSSSDDDSERLFELSDREEERRTLGASGTAEQDVRRAEEQVSVAHDRHDRYIQHHQLRQHRQRQPERAHSTDQRHNASYVPCDSYHDLLEDTAPLDRRAWPTPLTCPYDITLEHHRQQQGRGDLTHRLVCHAQRGPSGCCAFEAWGECGL